MDDSNRLLSFRSAIKECVMIKQKDIAAATGYSLSVVSRALSANPTKSDTVSQATKDHVREVAQEMGYSHNHDASCLRRGKKPAVGVFLPVWKDPLICELVMGISDGANQHGLSLNFHFGLTEENYARFLNTTTAQCNSAMISYLKHLGSDLNDKLLRKIDLYIKSGGKAILMRTLKHNPRNIPTLNMDEEWGGRLAAEYLVSRKCQTYHALLSSEELSQARAKGFSDYLASHKIKAEMIVPENLEKPVFNDLLSKLTCGSDDVFGVFSARDFLTRHLTHTLTQEGVELGGKIHLVSYDRLLRQREPIELPRIIQPFYEMGYKAITNIYKLLSGENIVAEKLKPTLQFRDDND